MLRLILALSSLLLLASCQSTARRGSVSHVVAVWLKEPGNAAQRQQLLAVGRSLRSIPGLLSLEQGQCLPSPRPIVDSTYDVAFIMRFPDAAAMQAYLTHPSHVKAANETLKPLSRRIQVYDFTVED